MRAGERDFIDIRMRGECRTGGFAEPGDHVDHSGRHAGFQAKFGQAQRRQRRLLGGLQHDGAAGKATRAGPIFQIDAGQRAIPTG